MTEKKRKKKELEKKQDQLVEDLFLDCIKVCRKQATGMERNDGKKGRCFLFLGGLGLSEIQESLDSLGEKQM